MKEPTPSQELEDKELCGKAVYWWSGEYEGNCELPQGHLEPFHYDGTSYYDDEENDRTYEQENLEKLIKQHELSRKQEWAESLIKKLPNRKAKSFIKTVHLTNDEYKYSSAFKDGHNACLDQVIKTIKEQSKE